MLFSAKRFTFTTNIADVNKTEERCRSTRCLCLYIALIFTVKVLNCLPWNTCCKDYCRSDKLARYVKLPALRTLLLIEFSCALLNARKIGKSVW